MPLITLSFGTEFSAGSGATILDAATQAQVQMAYSCRTGRCSTCKCKVLSGSTRALQAETGLTDQEKVEGWILSCVRTALSDLMLEAEDLGGIVLPVSKTLSFRAYGSQRLAHDVLMSKSIKLLHFFNLVDLFYLVNYENSRL